MSMELTKRLWEQPTDKGVLAYHMLPRCRKNYGKQNLPHRKNEMR